MNIVEKIKVAAAKRDPDERVALWRWRVETLELKQGQLDELNHDLAQGIDDLENGGYWACYAANTGQLAKAVGLIARQCFKNHAQES